MYVPGSRDLQRRCDTGNQKVASCYASHSSPLALENSMMNHDATFIHPSSPDPAPLGERQAVEFSVNVSIDPVLNLSCSS